MAVVTAIASGETRLSASLLTQDGAAMSAGLAHCFRRDPTNQWCAGATPLVLVVR